MTHLIESIESIYKSIPLGTRSFAQSVTIHLGTRSVDTEALIEIFKGKSISIVQPLVPTKHHKRDVEWILDGTRLHINILF